MDDGITVTDANAVILPGILRLLASQVTLPRRQSDRTQAFLNPTLSTKRSTPQCGETLLTAGDGKVSCGIVERMARFIPNI